MLGKMKQSPVDPLFTIEEITAQEEELVLDSFTQKDVKALGDIMHQINEDYQMAFAFEIYINGLVAYKYLPEGTGMINDLWMEKKVRTVMTMNYSTMRYWIVTESIGGKRNPDLYPTEPIVMCGGGFPIHVKSAGVIGAIACSGPGDQNDHLFCVEALRRFKDSSSN